MRLSACAHAGGKVFVVGEPSSAVMVCAVCERCGMEPWCLTRQWQIKSRTTWPTSHPCVFAVATGDVILMSTAGPCSTTHFAQAVIPTKKVHDLLDALCIGVALENGVRWTAHPNKVMVMLLTVKRLVQRGLGSPCQVQQILSTLQWHDLIFRPNLSEHQHICGFADGRQDKQGKTHPHVSLEILYSVHCWVSSVG